MKADKGERCEFCNSALHGRAECPVEAVWIANIAELNRRRV